MKLQKSIIALFALFVFAVTANAQFGDIMNKVQKKVDKTTKKVNTDTNVNTNGGSGSMSQTDDGARWDLFKCNPKYVGTVDENRLREMVQYNVKGYMGNGGLIVFTKQPLAKENPTIADSVMTFKGGDPIYMTLVLPEAKELDDAIALSSGGDAITTVGDYQKQCEAGYYKNKLDVDYGRFDGRIPKLLKLDFQPADGKSVKYQQQIKAIAVTLRNLKPGVHLVPVRIADNNGDVAAVGAFYYDNRDGNGGDSAAITAGLKAVTMPAASKKFAALEKQMSAAGGTLRTVVTDTDWTPLRHEISGVLIGRAISAMSAMKNKDGSCYRETQTWTQDYNGSTYTNLRITGIRDETDMACENAMK